jgi:hypothetical protein
VAETFDPVLSDAHGQSLHRHRRAALAPASARRRPGIGRAVRPGVVGRGPACPAATLLAR